MESTPSDCMAPNNSVKADMTVPCQFDQYNPAKGVPALQCSPGYYLTENNTCDGKYPQISFPLIVIITVHVKVRLTS